MKLKTKIWLLLGALMSLVLVIDLTISYQKLTAELWSEAAYDAKTVYGFMMATRRIYQQQFVDSGLPINDKTIGFLPAHSFSRISRDFANWNQSGIIFNNVSDVPRNPGNQADRFELEDMAWFRADSKATDRIRDIVTDKGIGYLLYTAPIRIEPYCLKCHGERDAAPPSIRERYATAYGYKLGDLRGVVSIKIPTEKFDARRLRLWGGQLMKSLAGYLVIFLALGFILDRLVTRRLSRLQMGAQQFAVGNYAARVEDEQRDEIAYFTRTFNYMADEVQARDQALGKLSLAVEQSPESIVITDLDGRIEYVNESFVRITGYSREEALGANPRILQSGRTPPETYQSLWMSLTQGQAWRGEFINQRKDGCEYIESAIISPVRADNGRITHYLAVKQDITDKKQAEAQIYHLAYFDALTGMPNRRLLLDRLQQALASSARNGQKGALLFIDLDNFKTLNDTLGHDIGDLLLQQVAERLESCVRESDTVARLGGDEFVVMLIDLNENALEAAAQTEAFAHKILAVLNQPYQLATHECRSTPSIGVTLFNNHEQGIEELLKQADIAMYQAKKAGRNAVRFFDPMMQDSINARAAIENELSKALENRQFQLYYQIQMDDLHRPIGAEALIRWIHPGRGLVSPAQFIPLADETGLILPIGLWVLEAACAQLKAWQQESLTRDLVLAVNVSAKQFRQADFASQVQAMVKHHAINPNCLKLELTESLLLDNIEGTITTMNALKDIGIRLSLDDFGTGYSSLQYLKRLPLDQLKIDQSFVLNLATDNSDKAIVHTIIAMAQSLNLDVIAEGVETAEQRQFLLGKGCHHYQGYLFGKPVPIEEFDALLKQG